MRQEVYSGYAKLNGKEHSDTIGAAHNYAATLKDLQRFEEAKALMRKTTPVARRILGESHEITLGMRQNYALALFEYSAATLDDVREAVTTLEEIERIARRVFGGEHPLTTGIQDALREARAALRARENEESNKHQN